VKKELAAIYKFVIGFAWVVITFWSCADDPGKLGYDLLPSGDLVSVRKVIETNIKAFTEVDLKQRTDEPAFNLLGSFYDPIFGKTTTDFACQFRLGHFPDFSNNAQPDSIVLYLYYKEFYGDTTAQQHFKVYELGSDLVFKSKYYQDENLKGYTKPALLADYSYTPKFRLDSLTNYYGSTKADPKDTATQIIAIKLNPTLANYLMSSDSATLSDNDKFLSYFKGLYVEATDMSSGGAIMKINTVAQQNTIGHGSYLVLHYHNNAEDSLYYSYGITKETSARVSRFSHDYSNTAFAGNLGQEVNQDSLIYLQTTGGLRTKILIPNLGNWVDSTDYAINQAELIFTVDPIVSDTAHYTTPLQLALVAIAKTKAGVDSLYYPSDYSFSPSYFGGQFNESDLTYRFNIAKHLQDIIDRKKENMGFYIETILKNSEYTRVALKGGTSKTGIKLQITYSKIK